MEPLKSLFANRAPPKQKRSSERGDLLEFFTNNINAERAGTKYRPLSIGYIAKRLQGLEVKDLYHLKSICEDARRRAPMVTLKNETEAQRRKRIEGSFSKKFWFELDPSKH
ncbi:hypothetical protein [Rhodopseudomonas palustris]|uniref:hypothetical protein n=1 Tax=Rhodopseudomonas palustris TaxID=1076 RepID=UPI000D1ABB50|nr:hypothetical protein [Rhodopseudomonas palustris]AVT83645.1 hypothetical protein RPYSC3_47850 [Rhodopseudomonas palustris]